MHIHERHSYVAILDGEGELRDEFRRENEDRRVFGLDDAGHGIAFESTENYWHPNHTLDDQREVAPVNPVMARPIAEVRALPLPST